MKMERTVDFILTNTTQQYKQLATDVRYTDVNTIP